jgi:hypothetical protein
MAVIIAVKPKVPAEQAARTAAKNDPTPDDKAMEEMRKVAEEARLQKLLDAGHKGATGGGKKAGGTVKYARGGGIEQRGKTRGKIV